METSDLKSFSEILKMSRKRQGLTQQQLARKLDIHQNTLGAWERGDYLPATRGMILELGRCLRLNKAEVYQLLEASLLAATPRWNIPYQHNPFFVGRRMILQQIHTLLSEKQNVASNRSCVLHGPGGFGKTQTAIEYAYRYALEYAAVFWINTETEEELLESFVAMSKTLKLSMNSVPTREVLVSMALDWLKTHRDWLLIFDNVVEKALVQRFVPTSCNGALLLTTRLPTLGTLAPRLALPPLSVEESIRLLLSRTVRQPFQQPTTSLSEKEIEAIQEIVRSMDGLPLALDQAAAYIEESQCSFSYFLTLFQYNMLQMLKEHPSSVTYLHSVEQTFVIAFERLKQQNPAAADMLLMCCFLAPEEIPEAFFSQGAAHLNTQLRATLLDPFQFNHALKDLLACALLRRNAVNGTLSIHPLVQTVLKGHMPDQRTQIAWLIHLLNQLFPAEQSVADKHCWVWCEQMLPHVQYVSQAAKSFQLVSCELDALLNKVTAYFSHRTRCEQTTSRYACPLSAPALTLHDQQERYQEDTHPVRTMYLEHYTEVFELQERDAAASRLPDREIRAMYQSVQQDRQMPLTEDDDEDSASDLFERFLQERCVLSAQASSRTVDLWRVYQEWTQTHEQRLPLSRQMFAFQLQLKGCYPARTNTHRIWHGIELRSC